MPLLIALYRAMKKPKTTPNSLKSNPHHPGVTVDAGRAHRNPLEYDHPYPSMAEFAKLLALRFDSNRTCHAYYRDMRLVHDHIGCDPAAVSEKQFRDYILYVKTVKKWRPKTIRQTAASAKLFFVEMLGLEQWTVFSQIKTKDHTVLPVHDIRGDENKLWVRHGKGHKDRLVPIADTMVEDLRRYWKFHRHPLLLFPSAGRGEQTPEKVAARMAASSRPMPYGSLQRLLLEARTELDLPDVSPHTLRYSFATHLVEGGASLHTVQAILGHRQINTTMVYLHLTHRSEQDSLRLVEDLCRDLPR